MPIDAEEWLYGTDQEMMDRALAFLAERPQGVFLTKMQERLRLGKPLTEVQCWRVLEMEVTYRFRARIRTVDLVTRDRKRARRQKQLPVRLATLRPGRSTYLVDDSAEGPVRVDINRPRSGIWMGWAFVTFTFRGGVQRGGAQSYGPGEVYRGPFKHILAEVVADPEAGVNRFVQSKG